MTGFDHRTSPLAHVYREHHHSARNRKNQSQDRLESSRRAYEISDYEDQGSQQNDRRDRHDQDIRGTSKTTAANVCPAPKKVESDHQEV